MRPPAPRPSDRSRSRPARLVLRYRRRVVIRLLVLLPLAACSSDAAPPKDKPAEDPPIKLAGVYAERFECTTIIANDTLAQLLGGQVRKIDSAISMPRGLPRPCSYEVSSDPPAVWTYDFDCRDGYKMRADALFKQYRETNTARIEEYNRVSDAGVPKAPKGAEDAAVVLKQPGNASEVAVGAKALDHNDQGLLFIDDDAPCYVRVNGPDTTKRLELAKLVSKQLTFANAPMTPRPLK
jgi:hypothetical protein